MFTIMEWSTSKFQQQHEKAELFFLYMPRYSVGPFPPLNFALKGFCQNSVSFHVFHKIISDKERCLTPANITWKNSTSGGNGENGGFPKVVFLATRKLDNSFKIINSIN